MQTVLERQAVVLPSHGRFRSRSVPVDLDTSTVRLRVGRPTDGGEVDWPAEAEVRVRIGVLAGARECGCGMGARGGARYHPSLVGGLTEITEEVLEYLIPWGHFERREGYPVRLGRRGGHIEVWAEVECLYGPGIETWLELESASAPAPDVPFHSSIAHVQSTGATGSGTSVSLAYGSNNTAGSLLVAGCGYTPSGSHDAVGISDDSSNSWTEIVESGPLSARYCALWQAPNVAVGANTVTADFTTDQFDIMLGIAEYSGAATSSPKLAHAVNTGSGTTASTSALTASGDGELIVQATTWNNPAAITPGTDWNERVENNSAFNRFQFQDFILNGESGVTPSNTASSSDWVTAAAIFRIPPTLPTSGLTFHAYAGSSATVFTTYSASGIHTGTPADGNETDVWEDDAWGITNIILVNDAAGEAPAYRTGGSAVMKSGRSELDFDGSNDYYFAAPQTGGTTALSSFISSSAFTIAAAFQVVSLTADNANYYDNPALFSDGAGTYLTLGVRNDGGQRKVGIQCFNATDGYVKAEANITVGQTHYAIATLNGGTLSIAVDGGTASTASLPNGVGVLTNAVRVGKGNTDTFNGPIGQLATWNTAKTGADLTTIQSEFGEWLTAAAATVSRRMLLGVGA